MKKARRERGKVVDPNGEIEMRVIWEDAPADYKVNGKSIIGAEMDFSLEEFTDAYKVLKREKPVVVGEECAPN